MRCSKCNFENVPGAAFCGSCGSPLPAAQPMGQPASPSDMDVVTVSINSASKPAIKEMPNNDTTKNDSSKTVLMDVVQTAGANEENTTVLTNNMAPMAAMANSQGTSGQPSFNNQGAPKQNIPMQPAPKQANAPQPGAPKQANVPQPGAPKQANVPQPGAPKQTKKSKGALVYTIISIIIMVGMAAAIVVGYLHFTGKVDDANKAKDELASAADASATDYQNLINDKDNQIATLESQVASLEGEKEVYEQQIATFEGELESISATADMYAAYDGLIGFANNCAGTTSADFFASTNVIHLTAGMETYVVVYSPNGFAGVEGFDTGVAIVELAGEPTPEGLYTFKVTYSGSGSTVANFINESGASFMTFIYAD